MKKEKTKYTSIGGSALIEGVMMRSPQKTAIAVRKENGEIVLKVSENKKPLPVIPKIPILRGLVSFVQSMMLSYSSIMYAADVAMEGIQEEEPPETEFEKFLTKLFGKTGMAILGAVAMVIGVLLGVSGGYIWGFGVSALVYWLFTALFKDNSPVRLISLCLGLVLCYLLGSLWYMHAYLQGQSFIFVLAKCVLPYCLPDACKLTLAFTLSNKLKNHIKIK